MLDAEDRTIACGRKWRKWERGGSKPAKKCLSFRFRHVHAQQARDGREVRQVDAAGAVPVEYLEGGGESLSALEEAGELFAEERLKRVEPAAADDGLEDGVAVAHGGRVLGHERLSGWAAPAAARLVPAEVAVHVGGLPHVPAAEVEAVAVVDVRSCLGRKTGLNNGQLVVICSLQGFAAGVRVSSAVRTLNQ